METDRSIMNIEERLSTPRKLCKTCYEWLTQEDVGDNDFPHCGRDNYECRNYLYGSEDKCPYYLNQ